MWTYILLLAILYYTYRDQSNSSVNIVSSIKKIGYWLADIGIYSANRFSSIDWSVSVDQS